MSRGLPRLQGTGVQPDGDPSITREACPKLPQPIHSYQNLGSLCQPASLMSAVKQFLPSWPLLGGQRWGAARRRSFHRARYPRAKANARSARRFGAVTADNIPRIKPHPTNKTVSHEQTCIPMIWSSASTIHTDKGSCQKISSSQNRDSTSSYEPCITLLKASRLETSTRLSTL